MENKFNVKENSCLEFLTTRLIGYDAERAKYESPNGRITAYNLLRDVMFFKKSEDLKVGDSIFIELFDESIHNRSKLINKYQYIIEEYDSISVKVSLVSFNVELIN